MEVIKAVEPAEGYVKRIQRGGSMRWISCGEIRMAAGSPVVSLFEEDQETAILALSGESRIYSDARYFPMRKHDIFYLPRGCRAAIESEGSAHLLVCSSPVKGEYPLQYIPFDSVVSDPAVHFVAGSDGASREISLLLGNKAEAGRLLIGVTRSSPGNWTSWPPHEHAQTLEEIYFYYDMPYPTYGLQLLYDTDAQSGSVAVVREGDLVLMPSGYHPNAAIPGHSLNFVWVMAAHVEGKDRRWGVVNVDPQFRL